MVWKTQTSSPIARLQLLRKSFRSMQLFLICTLLFSIVGCSKAIEDFVNKAAKDATIPTVAAKHEIYVDVETLTLSEGSVAIINVAIDPISDSDVVVSILLTGLANNAVKLSHIPPRIVVWEGALRGFDLAFI